MKKYIVIFKVDHNDGDYFESTAIITEDKLELLKKIAKVVMSNRGYNWGNYDHSEYIHGDKLTEDEREFFSGLLPCGEPCFHSIENIEYWEIIGEKVNLNYS